MIVLLMGVAGSGKTTVGRLLAASLGCRFVDADDHHSPANLAKMSRGEPLTDADRAPWLATLAALLRAASRDSGNLVLACSALKAAYREQLTADTTDVRLVFLHGSFAVLQARLANRTAHFMPASLLRSQFGDLEPPGTEALTLPADLPPDELVRRIRTAFAGSP